MIGSAGFKGPPKRGKVEIAYMTFDEFQGQGLGRQMCAALVRRATEADPSVIISARTLPEDGASPSILRHNNFELQGTVMDDEDGEVWEWVHRVDKND